ncbi:glycosyltransferase family 4 protein [Pseudohalioglobus sediminis]|uniref:Glycosyltransferase family 4 protein n=1 Tax=Pseudohalioglobus sediminis TaxID=2606449 RepID=A0A5B0WQS0_9GAMM|nr:glycosyltransferase family 4 protein [Pseudohalioglobus sediminis]KAA1188937.1 glycosyltransferase family 4 protein [Pseudohalioglobus sediminis]
MPWRTIYEVCRCFCLADHTSIILSGKQREVKNEWAIGHVRVRDVLKPKSDSALKKLAHVLKEEDIDILYWPLDWRSPRTDLLQLEITGLRVTWYIPGAWYGHGQVFKAAAHMRSKAVLPYVAQVLGSRRQFVKKLTAGGVRPLIVMTDYSRNKLVENGYPPSACHSIPPGKEKLLILDEPPVVFNEFRNDLQGKPYFLFFGPPQKIRGVAEMLSAFKTVARQHPDIKLVCLFRSDPGLDASHWKRMIERMDCKDRIHCIWTSVGPADLDYFLRNCFAVLKPFLLVPSEIPLAVIETAEYGKPVIGTGPDGTGKFIGDFGLTVPFASPKKLAQAMLELLSNKELYSEKCRAAKHVYEGHPTWDEVANRWLKATQLQT